MNRYLLYIGFLGLLHLYVPAQSNTIRSAEELEMVQLEKALENDDEKAQAESYYRLGNRYAKSLEYSKAEEFYQKSLKLYTKLKNKSKISEVSRKLAQVQEKLNKTELAIDNFNNAYSNTVSPQEQTLNRNDANRLQSSDFEDQAQNISYNIKINETQQAKEELLNNYTQMAEVQRNQNQIENAKINLDQAYALAKITAPRMAAKINSDKAEILKEENKIEEAIAVKKSILKEDFVQKDSQIENEQLQELASLYEANNEFEEALTTLEMAYEKALEKGHTLQAQAALQKMDSAYRRQKKYGVVDQHYRDFVQKLPGLIEKDSALVSEQVLNESQEKIKLLENEKSLNASLVQKKNTLNYTLMGGVLLLIGFLAYALFSFRKLQLQNKRIALQSLKKDMNPHFIFNSLNSINQYISTNDERSANRYLTRFASLMRTTLDHSSEDFIPLELEIDWLENYLSLEHQRFQDRFEYKIQVDESLLNQEMEVPVMGIQPFIENAIWHGLRYRESAGELNISFQKEGDDLVISIQDNGIGMEESKKRKTHFQKAQQGIGISNTLERFKYLKEVYGKEITVEFQARNPGVEVKIKMLG